ncbi:MAG: cytochrome c [Flavobacteriaceae bacterium]|nr:MAG: cytochrome c [Flavobacteriaceae bacterium]
MKKHICLFLGFALFASCTKAVIEDTPVLPSPIMVKYNNGVKTIIDNNCVSCHGATSPDAGLSLTTYTQVRTAAESGNLINRINDATRPMPPAALMSSTNRAAITRWMTDGYLEN